jgi:hypothetical protein
MGSVLKYSSDSDKGCGWPSEPQLEREGSSRLPQAELRRTGEHFKGENSSEEDNIASIQLAGNSLDRCALHHVVARAAQLGQAGALLDEQFSYNRLGEVLIHCIACSSVISYDVTDLCYSTWALNLRPGKISCASAWRSWRHDGRRHVQMRAAFMGNVF